MSNKTIEFFTNDEDVGKRLDILLSEKIVHLTRSNLKKIIESKHVKINGKVVVSPSKKIKLTENVFVELIEDTKKENIKPSNIKRILNNNRNNSKLRRMKMNNARKRKEIKTKKMLK